MVGLRDRIIANVNTSTADLKAYNPNYIGGDIIGGANDGLQVILRPRISVNPYATGVPGVYLCRSPRHREPGSTARVAITPPRRPWAGPAERFSR